MPPSYSDSWNRLMSPSPPAYDGADEEIPDLVQDSDSDATMVDSPDVYASNSLPTATTATPARAHFTRSPSPIAIPDAFDTLPHPEREDLYRTYFNYSIPIELITKSDLSRAYPALKAEISTACLAYTTFVFRVFTNYDAGGDFFYAETPSYNKARHADCGKLILSPRATKYLESINAHKARFANVRLDISSHLTPLAQVTLEVRRTRLDVGVVVDAFINMLPRHKVCRRGTKAWLQEFVKGVVDQITDAGRDVTGGKIGFNIEDLGRVAELFVAVQTRAEKTETYRNNYEGAWEKGGRNGAWMEALA